MKKFLKCFLIVPIIFIAIFTLFACGDDDEISRINLSIPGYTLTEGFYTLDKAKIEGDRKRIPLSVSTDNSSFSVSNLNYSSSFPEVAQVTRNNENFFIILKNNGQAKITFSYKKNNGTIISAEINVLVNDTTRNIYFDKFTYETTYTGEDLQNNYRIVQDDNPTADEDDSQYYYSYYLINAGDGKEPTEVNNIIDVGRYRITCSSKENIDDYAETYLIVKKAKLSFVAKDNTAYYGDALPDGLYYEGDVPSEVTAFEDAESLTGIGREAGKEIGKITETTKAKRGSNVGRYATTVKMTLNSDYQKNYSIEYDVEEGYLTINPKKVAVKGKEQSSIYGDAIEIEFDLYDYDAYEKKGFSTEGLEPLDTTEVNYKKDISLDSRRDVIYKNTDGEVVSLNQNNCLDVLIKQKIDDFKQYEAYQVFFDKVTTSPNLIVDKTNGLMPGSIIIAPRPVTILPKRNLSKVYGTSDPVLDDKSFSVVAGSFINADASLDKNFLRISYNAYNLDVGEGGDKLEEITNPLGEGNFKASIGKYYYNIATTKKVGENQTDINNNYDILLDERATDSKNVDEQERVMFEVTRCPIVIEMNPLGSRENIVRYVAPKSSDGIHSFGYFGNEEDYKLDIKTLTINGVPADISNITGENPTGLIPLPAGGNFSFLIGVSKVENPDFYVSYKTILAGKTFEKPGKEEIDGNYLVTLKSSSINLSKIKVIVTPDTTYGFSKTYDGKEIRTTDDTLNTSLFAIKEEGEGNFVYPFINSVIVNEDSETQETKLLTDIINFERTKTLLTLFAKDSFLKYKNNNTYENVPFFKDVGEYKINLIDESSLVYNEGQECYQLVLDTTARYNYKINKKLATIVPEAVETEKDEEGNIITTYQSKVYGDKDPDEILFKIINTADNEEISRTGKLKRTIGENVGDYYVDIADISIGGNYDLTLSSAVPFVFRILPRKVTVMPRSQSYVYGDTLQPLDAECEVEGKLDEDLLKAGKVSNYASKGNFSLALDKEDETSIIGLDVSNFYPVLLNEDGSIGSYYIVLGTGDNKYGSRTNNYYIEFIDTATFTVTKRDAVIYINEIYDKTPEFVKGEAEKEKVILTNYTISNLVDKDNVNKVFEVKLNTPNLVYCDFTPVNTEETTSWWLALEVNGESVKENYNIILANNVVYTFGTTIVSLAIVTKDSGVENYSSNFDAIFSGKPFNDEFKLVCLTPNYEIVYGEEGGEVKTNFQFKYIRGGENDTPLNVGSYVVNIDMESTGFQIVLRNTTLGTEIKFDKDTIGLEADPVEQTKLNISNSGYISIRKAKIIYDPEEVVFDGTFMYVETKNYTQNELLRLMPDLREGNIFKGVEIDGRNVPLNLVRYTETNKNYVASGFSFTNFKANYTYNITVTIEARSSTSNGADNNYEKLTIPGVQLKISPKEMNVSNPVFRTKVGDNHLSTSLVYDGTLKSLKLSLDGDANQYVITYSYQKLAIKSNSTGNSVEVYYRLLDNGVPDESNKEPLTMGGDKLYTINVNDFEIKNFGSSYYAIVNNHYCFLMQNGDGNSVSPNNAGAYICIATCSANENYAFVKDGQTVSTNQYACLFEIQKAGARDNDILLEGWVDKFYYSTPFIFDDDPKKSNLPFSYSISPAFLKDYVQYSMDLSDLSTGGYLPFKQEPYKVTLTFNTENYYKEYKDMEFYITKLEVNFIFPATKNYVYIGLNNPVKSFLPNIRVVQRDFKNNVVGSFYYDEDSKDCKDIKLAYENLNDNKGIIQIENSNGLPYEVGEYRLIMTYGDENTTGVGNYYGTGSFDYIIEEKAFTGSIRVENATMTYNPNANPKDFYDEIVRRMFSIDIKEDEYDLELYSGSKDTGVKMDRDLKLDYDDENFSRDSLGWLKDVNYEGQHYITFVIKFKIDTTTKSLTRSAILTIKKVTLSQKDFNYNATTSATYRYNGYRVYNYIAYGSKGEIPLDPDDTSKLEAKKYITIEDKIYHFKTALEGKNKYVILQDSMFNTIFELRYVYTDGSGQSLDGAPIEPGNNYKVTYKITGGDNYMTGGIGSPSKQFNIEKLSFLYISLNSIDNTSLVYSGTNLVDPKKSGNDRTLGNIVIANNIIVKLNDGTGSSNVNFTLLDSSLYNPTYGVYLQVYFTDRNNNLVTVENAGSYRMHVSLAYTDGYDIMKYFTAVRFIQTGVSYKDVKVEELAPAVVDGIERSWYDQSVSVDFEVKKSGLNMTGDRWHEIFSLPEGTPEPTISGNYIYINSASNVTITANKSANLEVGRWIGSEATDVKTVSDGESITLSVGSTYRIFIAASENYERGGPIFVVIRNS